MPLTYNPSVFHVNDIPQAMTIIMTPEGSTTADRWEKETPYMADIIAEQFAITADSLVLDYGCGIGRMSHELIKRHNCLVVGVDICPACAPFRSVYTRSDRFMSCSQEMLEGLVARGMTFDAGCNLGAAALHGAGRGHGAHQERAQAGWRPVPRQRQPALGPDRRAGLGE